LATCFGRDRPFSGQLRTQLRYSQNSTQRDAISFTLNLDKIWNFLLKIKNFRILSWFNVKEMLSPWVLFWLYLHWVLSWPEGGRSRPKYAAKYYLIVIIASCLIYVVYWRCIIYYTKENIMDVWLIHFNASSHIWRKSNFLSPIIKSYKLSIFKKI